MAEFHDRYGTEAKCAEALEKSRWPVGFVCPECGDKRCSRFVRGGRMHWQRHRCRPQTTVTSGTIFQATKLHLTSWFFAMHLITQAMNNVSAQELKRHLGICYKTAWLIKHKLLEVMAGREDQRVLDNRMEVDDACLGSEKAGTRGRGSENKTPFVAAVQTTDDGRPLFVCMKRLPFTNEAIAAWANRAIAASAHVVSDGLHCFAAFKDLVSRHEPQIVGSGRQAGSRAS